MRSDALLVDVVKIPYNHALLLQVSWLAKEWLSNVRSPAGNQIDLEAQRRIRLNISQAYMAICQEN